MSHAVQLNTFLRLLCLCIMNAKIILVTAAMYSQALLKLSIVALLYNNINRDSPKNLWEHYFLASTLKFPTPTFLLPDHDVFRK